MFKCPEKYRQGEFERRVYGGDGDSGNGVFMARSPVHRDLCMIASDGGGWEHVSVHIVKRPSMAPTWDEMCFVKDLFWGDEDVVLQIHPRKAEHVNFHKGTLHLWRSTEHEFVTPPSSFVGPSTVGKG